MKRKGIVLPTALSKSDYPKLNFPDAILSLQGHHPVWLLSPDGFVVNSNLMAFWLWGALRFGEEIKLNNLLGINVFEILSRNLKRIPKSKNQEFFAKKSSVVKRLSAVYGFKPYISFINALRTDTDLKKSYEEATPNPDLEWNYPLRIIPSEQMEDTQLLEFRVHVYTLEGETGYIATYQPTSASVFAVEKKYNQLIDHYHSDAYVQPKFVQVDEIKFYPAYYPFLTHDLLWNITGENKAHKALVGSFHGKHFFELFFAPQLHEWLGPLQETSAPRALWFFDQLTKDYQQTDNAKHSEYGKVMRRLLQIPGFEDLLKLSRKIPYRINLKEISASAFPMYICLVFLPWPFSKEIMLQFKSMVQFPHKGQADYKLTLVPVNSETKVALILLDLVGIVSRSDSKSKDAIYGAQDQYLIGLTLLETLLEGITREKDDNLWNPQAAFSRIHSKLSLEYRIVTDEAKHQLISRALMLIDAFDRNQIITKRDLLEMLLDISDNKLYLKSMLKMQLEAFEKKEKYRAVRFPSDRAKVNDVIRYLLDNKIITSFDVLTGSWLVSPEVAQELREQFGCEDITDEWHSELTRGEGSRIFFKDTEGSEAFIVDYEKKAFYYFNAGDLQPVTDPSFVPERISQSTSLRWTSEKEIYPSLREAVQSFLEESLMVREKMGL